MRRVLLSRVLTVGVLAAAVAGNTGCSTMNNTEKGALGGGAIGAGLGTLVGAATGNPKTGAVVGGLVGAGAGGLIGNDMDRKDARDAAVRRDAAAQQASQQYAADQPTRLAEVVELSKRGMGETVILNHIRTNRMSFNLSVADLDYLKSNGVSDRVIAEMQTGPAAPPTVIRTAAPRTVVVREEVPVVVPAYGGYWGPPPAVIVTRPQPVYGATFNFRR